MTGLNLSNSNHRGSRSGGISQTETAEGTRGLRGGARETQSRGLSLGPPPSLGAQPHARRTATRCFRARTVSTRGPLPDLQPQEPVLSWKVEITEGRETLRSHLRLAEP